jgi:hypothetical protein
VKPNEEYGMAELFFQAPNPSIPSSIPFKLEKLYFNDTRPTATMSYTIQPDLDAGGSGNPLENLKIIRENIMGDSLGSFKVTHTFINQSKKPMTFGIRMRNIPINRWKPESGPQALLTNGTEIPRGTQTYLLPNAKIEWSELGSPKPLDDLAVTIRHGNMPLYYKILGDFTGLYCWSNHLMQTVEPLTDTITLAPGQSKTFTTYIKVVDERQK